MHTRSTLPACVLWALGTLVVILPLSGCSAGSDSSGAVATKPTSTPTHNCHPHLDKNTGLFVTTCGATGATSSDSATSEYTPTPVPAGASDALALQGSTSKKDGEGYTWSVSYNYRAGESGFSSNGSQDLPGFTDLTLTPDVSSLSLTNTTDGHNLDSLGSDTWVVIGQYASSSAVCTDLPDGATDSDGSRCNLVLDSGDLSETNGLQPSQTVGGANGLNEPRTLMGVRENQVSTIEASVLNPDDLVIGFENDNLDSRFESFCRISNGSLTVGYVVVGSTGSPICNHT